MKIRTFQKSVVLALSLAGTQFGSAATIVSEGFGGDTEAPLPLNGTSADTFSSAITTAGGSATWVAGGSYTDTGEIWGQSSAYLNLGTYINDARGTADGKFILSATFNSNALSSWQSFGFFQSQTPALGQFTSVGGMATLIYRSTGELDGFGGVNTGNPVDGDNVSGQQLLTVVLDLTPDGGYNGSDNFGTVTFLDGDFATGVPISAAPSTAYTYTSLQTFGSVGISGSQAAQEGTILDLSLEQVVIPEPSIASLAGILGVLLLLQRRR